MLQDALEELGVDRGNTSDSAVIRFERAGPRVLVVEQNANVSLSIADRGYVLSTGRVVLEGKAGDLLEDEDLR